MHNLSIHTFYMSIFTAKCKKQYFCVHWQKIAQQACAVCAFFQLWYSLFWYVCNHHQHHLSSLSLIGLSKKNIQQNHWLSTPLSCMQQMVFFPDTKIFLRTLVLLDCGFKSCFLGLGGVFTCDWLALHILACCRRRPQVKTTQIIPWYMFELKYCS